MRKTKNTLSNLSFAFRYVYEICPLFIFLLLVSTLLNSINSIYSIVILKVILDTLVLKDISLLIKTAIFVFAISLLLENSYEYIQKKLIGLKQILIEKHTNLDIFQSVADMDIKEYDVTEKYDEVFFNLSEGYTNLLSLVQNFASLIGKLLSIFCITSIIGNCDIYMLLLIAFFVTVNACLNLISAKMNFKKTLALIPSSRGMDYIRRILYLKQYGAEIRLFQIFSILKKRYSQYAEDKYNTTKKYVFYELLVTSVQNILQISMQFLIIVLLAMKYIANQIVLGDFLVLYNSTMELSDYVTSFIDTFPDFYRNSLYINVLRNMIGNKSKNAIEHHKTIDSVNLHNIGFTYHTKPVLSNFNYRFERGKTYAIIGANGTGKSTLLKIICGLYEADYGEITINENPIQSKDELRICSSIALQDHQYYALTIAENILMHSYQEEDEAMVIALLRDVGLYERVISLPKGIQTHITQELDDQGTSFSGGEIQRLAIARALANIKDIMIFDEPTSALDSESICALQQLIFERTKLSILLYVTHNMSEISLFDNIINMT